MARKISLAICLLAEATKEERFANTIRALAEQKLGFPYGKGGYNCVTLILEILKEFAKSEGDRFYAPWFVNGGSLVKALSEPPRVSQPSQLTTKKGQLLMRAAEAKSLQEIRQHYKCGDMALVVKDGKAYAITQEEAEERFLKGEKVFLVKHYLLATENTVIHASRVQGKVVEESLKDYLQKNRNSIFIVVNLEDIYKLGTRTNALAEKK